MSWASAPANPAFNEFVFLSDFFRELLNRAYCAAKINAALAPANWLFNSRPTKNRNLGALCEKRRIRRAHQDLPECRSIKMRSIAREAR